MKTKMVKNIHSLYGNIAVWVCLDETFRLDSTDLLSRAHSNISNNKNYAGLT